MSQHRIIEYLPNLFDGRLVSMFLRLHSALEDSYDFINHKNQIVREKYLEEHDID